MNSAEINWFYGQWHSPISSKIVKFDALDAFEVINPTTKYFISFGKNGTLLVFLDTILAHHFDSFVGATDILIVLCEPA